MEKFFEKFPIISYSNTLCRDITRRVTMTDKLRRNAYAFYPYTVKSHDSFPDLIAWNYYQDPEMDWLVWMSSDMIDPYYAWPLDDNTFHSFIVKKYGSSEAAKQHILRWQVNWADTDVEISPAGYAALTEPLKKYYQAVYGQGTRVISYRRTERDWFTSTNMIVRFTVSANGESFTVGEKAQLKTGNTVHANVIVAWSNSSDVICQHVFGNTAVENTVLQGVSSNAVANVTQHYFTSNCIPIEERDFWEPVYAYDYELALNEERKNIRLVDTKYKLTITEDLKKKLR